MSETGIEPARYFYQQILSLSWLPDYITLTYSSISTYIIPQISHFVNTYFYIFILPIFISTNHLVHGNGLEVEILFNEIDLGIQSHSTFCPYKINIAYTALRTAPDSPSQPSYLGYIELF